MTQSSDYNNVMEISVNKRIFAGIVRRLFAFVIDLVILNLVFLAIYILLTLIGYTYIDYWIIFAIIFFLYFTFGDSCVHNGQTFGKKRINIQLLDIDGKPTDTLATLKRSLITTMVYFGYNIITFLESFLNHYFDNFWIYIFITLIYSILITGTTVYTAFHPFKQSLADSLAKTIVIVKGTFVNTVFEVENKIVKLFACYFFSAAVILLCVLCVIIIKLLF